MFKGPKICKCVYIYILMCAQQDIFTQVSTLIVHYEAQHLHNIMVLMLSNGAK